MKTPRWPALIAAALIALLEGPLFSAASSTANAAVPALCDMRLSAKLTPDVPNPLAPGFLSSLLNNHPGYRLLLQRQASGSVIVLDLRGPGPEYSCQDVIETIRRDARVLPVEVQGESS